MKKNLNISDEELSTFLQQFYNYFKTGYDFEKFLKVYLEKLGLDEVKVTQKSRDGGIDLTAVRLGVGEFSDADASNYYIQAKRFNPSSSISVRDIRELKGTIPFGHKGMFITTSKFSSDAINESNNDPSKPVVLIDGKQLIESCIDLELGFVFKPSFSNYLMDKLMGTNNDKQVEKPIEVEQDNPSRKFIVEKIITMNDIRARIVSLPSDVVKLIDENSNSICVKFGDIKEANYKYNPSRRFISGVTEFLNKYGLKGEIDLKPKKVAWYINNNKVFEVEVVD